MTKAQHKHYVVIHDRKGQRTQHHAWCTRHARELAHSHSLKNPMAEVRAVRNQGGINTVQCLFINGTEQKLPD